MGMYQHLEHLYDHRLQKINICNSSVELGRSQNIFWQCSHNWSQWEEYINMVTPESSAMGFLFVC